MPKKQQSATPPQAAVPEVDARRRRPPKRPPRPLLRRSCRPRRRPRATAPAAPSRPCRRTTCSRGSRRAPTPDRTPCSASTPRACPTRNAVVIRALRPLAREVVAVLDNGARVELGHIGHGVWQGVSVAGSRTTSSRRRTRTTSPGRRTTRTATSRPSATSTCTSSARAGTSASGTCSARTTARCPGVARETWGTAFAVWAPHARAVRVIGDFNNWNGVLHAMRRMDVHGIWELFVPDLAPVQRVQVRDPHRGRRVDREGRPDGAAHRAPAGDRLGRDREQLPLERLRLDERPRGAEPERPADQRLRDAPRLLAAGPRLPRRRRPADRLPARDRLHPRRVHAARGAPVRAVVGLPGHRLLRAHLAVRASGRPEVPDRPAAPGADRRLHGLGAGALPEGRLGAREVRRPAAVRAQRPAARRAPGLGHADLQLRRQPGAQLPRRERPLLARRVPRRRPAGRRRGVDALPRLLAQGRRVAAEPLRRAGEPRGDQLPAGDHRDGLQAAPRRHDDGGGVDQLGRRHPPHLQRRPRLRAQVEHGLDERLVALHRATIRCGATTTRTS